MFPPRRCALSVALLLASLAFAVPAAAQVETEAILGSPLGVGRISIRVDERATAGLSGLDAFEIVERRGRIVYPVRNAGLLDRLGALAGEETDPGRLSVTFLFWGNEPLDVTIYSPEKQTVRITPGGRPRQHTRLLRQWWRQFNASAQEFAGRADGSIADQYLVTMLSRRYGLAPVVAGRNLFPEPPKQGIGMIFAGDTIGATVMRDMLAVGRGSAGPADRKLPAAALRPLDAPAVAGEVDIEPIAQHVPEECFYIRFGSFANYRWMRDLTSEFGGDLGNMIESKGVDFNPGVRMERQIALRDSVVGNLFGASAITDVAMIGMDMYYRDGAAVGMLFHARNTKVLGDDFGKQRQEVLAKDKTAALTTEKIGGKDVTFLSTPDNLIRSYHAIEGDFHLVTTSRRMVERFFEAGAKRGSLGGSAEFRHARKTMPTSRGDTIFVYFSDAFMRNLASPQYRVETARRVASRVEMDLAKLARLSAKAEGFDDMSVEALQKRGFLPNDFARRSDGSQLEIGKDGSTRDTIRGGRGAFVPVPDVVVEGVTEREAADYEQFSAAVAQTIGKTEPIIIAIGRRDFNPKGPKRKAGDPPPTPMPPGDAPPAKTPNGEKSGALELVTIDARVSPFTGKTYEQIAGRVGPATKQYVEPLPGNLISVNAVLKNGGLEGILPVPFSALRGGDAGGEGHRVMFAGVGDFQGPVTAGSGLLESLGVVRQSNAYVGSWPEAGMLGRMLGLAEPLPRDEVGYREIFGVLGVWGMRLNEFAIVALNKEDLFDRARQLRVVEGERAAQVRINVQDLRGTHLAGLLNQMGHARTWAGSRGNAQYLHHLATQYQVPREDAAMLAHELTGSNFLCPLGGEYKLMSEKSGMESWVSTAWAKAPPPGQPPADYVSPPLVWFRGLNAEGTLEPGTLTIRAELVMERKARTRFTLPPLF